jgi:hypothetical protein
MNPFNARVVSFLGLAGIVVMLAVLLGHSERRRSGTDLTPNGAFVGFVSAGQEACQEQEPLPADTSAVQVTIGTRGLPGPPIQVTLSVPGGQTITYGGLGAGWHQGVVTIPVKRVTHALEGLRACLRDAGPQPIALAGTTPDAGYHFEVAGATVEGRLRYDYLRSGRESWLELLPTLAYRSTIARSNLIRHWAWAGAIVLMLLVAGVAVATIIREARP